MDKLAFDFETHLIDVQNPVPKPVCVSWYDGTSSGLETGMSAMEGFLSSALKSNKLLLAHNFNFEALVIFYYFPRLSPLLWQAMDDGRLFCTLTYERMLNNIRKKQQMQFNLAAVVLNYLKIDISESKNDVDSWRYRYAELDNVPQNEWPVAARDYAIKDSIYTYQVYQHQIQESQLKFKLNVNAGIALNIIGKTGLLIDQERVAYLKQEVTTYLTPRYDTLIARGFGAVVKGSFKKNIKQLQTYIETNYSDIHRTHKGAVDTKGITLDELLLKNPEDELLRTFREIKDYEKILTTYVNRLEQAQPYIYSDYTSVVSSGRTSSSQSTLYPSVNIQNQPRAVKGLTYDIRNCYKARAGYKLVSIDYAGLELASTAHQLQTLYKHSAMKETINSGELPVDMHSKLACQIKKVSYEHFMANKKLPEYKRYRQLAKPINLGFPGGIGYKVMRELLLKDGIFTHYYVLHTSDSLAQIKALLWNLRSEMSNLRIERTGARQYSLVYDELVELKHKLFDLYPELENFLKERHTRYQTGHSKYVKNDFGEWEEEPMHQYNVQGVVRDWCTYTALCNGFLMQTPAAIGAKLAVYTAVRKHYSNPNIVLLAFIHDEILFEVKDDADKYKNVEEIATIMIESMQTVLPSVRITVEASMMDYWTKAGGEFEKIYWKDPYNKELKSL